MAEILTLGIVIGIVLGAVFAAVAFAVMEEAGRSVAGLLRQWLWKRFLRRVERDRQGAKGENDG